jgi:hypothetical protein
LSPTPTVRIGSSNAMSHGGPETVGGQRISRNEADRRLALVRSDYGEERGERVDAGDELVLGGEPEGLPGADGPVATTGPRQLEVDPVAVVQDEELVAERLDVVLDLRLPRGHEDRGAVGCAASTRRYSVDVEDPTTDDDPAVVARRADADPEDLVGLLVDQDVLPSTGAPTSCRHTWNGRQASS